MPALNSREQHVSKRDEAKLIVTMNRGRQEIEIVVVKDGIRLGGVVFTPDEAAHHALTVMNGVKMLNQQQGGGLIIPGSEDRKLLQ